MHALPQERPSLFILSSVSTLEWARELAVRLGDQADASLGAWDVDSQFEPPLEALSSRLSEVDSLVALFDDDKGAAAGGRANIMFELGLAVGLLGPERVFIAGSPGIDLPFVLQGEHRFVVDLREPDGVDRLAGIIGARVGELGRRPSRTKRPLTAYVSYARTDLEFVRQLVSDLNEVGISSWLDEPGIGPGSHWRTEVHERLASSDRLIVVLSEAALQSEWVRKELTVASWRQTFTDAPVLFPVVLDDSISTVGGPWREQIRDIQALDFRQWANPTSYQRSLRRLMQALTASAALASR